MKLKYLILSILIIICISNTACSDDFNPNNSEPALPVIYGLYHLDEGRCEIYHSCTYNTIPRLSTETYFVLEGLQSGYPVWSTPLISYKPKIFSPKELLKANENGDIIGDGWKVNSFRIILHSLEYVQMVYAKIDILPRPILIEPSFIDKKMSLYGKHKFRIKLQIPSSVKRCDLNAVLHYEQDSGNKLTKSTSFNLLEDIFFNSENLTIQLNPELLFKKLALSFKDQIQPKNRKMITIDFYFLSTDNHFDSYIETYINASDMAGIPEGNIVNGIGIFSMVRTNKMEGFMFNQQTLDSLSSGQYTKHLNFVKW